MALRRVQSLVNLPYWQPIKLGFNLPLVVTPESQGNAIVTRMPATVAPIQMQLAAQYSETGNNINLIAYLERIPGRALVAGSCTFTLTELTGDGLFQPINTDTLPGTPNAANQWLGVIPAGDVITNVCMGKSTLKIQCVMTRANKTFKKEIYVNHLGIGEAAAWLRTRLNYVEATKKDETS